MEHSIQRILTAAGVFLLCTALFLLGAFSQFNHKLGDALYGGRPTLENIIIVGIDDASLQQIGRWPWARGNYSVLLERMDSATTIGLDIALLEPSDKQGDAAIGDSVLGKKNIILASEYTGFTQEGNTVNGKGLLKPVVLAATGYVNILTDGDGVVRSLDLSLGDEKAFASALYNSYTGRAPPIEQRFLINYAGQPGSFKQYSAADVILGKVSKEDFKGKVVLIGAVAPDFHDDALVPTSDGVLMPGVEIHANALQTMMLGNQLHEVPSWITALLIFVTIALVTFFVFRFSALTAAFLSLGIIILYIVIAFIVFKHGYIMNMVYVPFAVLTAFPLLMIGDVIYERVIKRKVMAAFSKYVSPDILDQILTKDIELGGERKEITILFSDIRGFTSISEKLNPEELVGFLNSYFTRVTKVIMDERGLVDKFIGDAIMAFWNAPLSDKEHAEHAVRAALSMKRELEEVRKEHAGKYPRLDVGIGINTGEAVVGNVGSNERLSYTAIGDSVNLASRLEGLTKYYGVHILISESTKKLIKNDIIVRELDLVKVKGKKEPVRIYEVVGLHSKGEHNQSIAKYEAALKLYYEGKWKEAAKEFALLEDATSKVMLERCKEFLENAPENWDGSYEMTHK